MNVYAGSDPDVIEYDGGCAGLGRRHRFFGFRSSEVPARIPEISAWPAILVF
jgi:hypothetical protein